MMGCRTTYFSDRPHSRGQWRVDLWPENRPVALLTPIVFTTISRFPSSSPTSPGPQSRADRPEFCAAARHRRSDALELSYEDRVISFEFAALDFTSPQRIVIVTCWKGSIMNGPKSAATPPGDIHQPQREIRVPRMDLTRRYLERPGCGTNAHDYAALVGNHLVSLVDGIAKRACSAVSLPASGAMQ